MPANLKTPGVYINEIDAFGNAVVPVPTNIPVFIGYTEKAEYEGKNYSQKPVKITSLAVFEAFFGQGPATTFTINAQEAKTANSFEIAGKYYTVSPTNQYYILYNQIQLFYQNGGGYCYVVSVGDYNSPINQNDFLAGLEKAKKEPEITLLLCPDAVLLDSVANYGTVMQQMLQQADELKNRFCILDVYNGTQDLSTSIITDFRNQTGTTGLSYGAAYYPFVNTTAVVYQDIVYTRIENQDLLATLLATDPNLPPLSQLEEQMPDANTLSQHLYKSSPVYATIVNAIVTRLNIQPQSGLVAGVYTLIDNTRGVWKAPANVGLDSVSSPVVTINSNQQEDLNVPVSGKSICATRMFTGMGTVIWGARTLDGNGNDWRYINVRRTMIYIEQSLKMAMQAYVFAPNDSNTWNAVKAMSESFLNNLWKQGGLIGAKPADAYNVSIGLGSTMTGDDILNGIMRLSVKVSLVRPAEFIVITIEQEMQKS